MYIGQPQRGLPAFPFNFLKKTIMGLICLTFLAIGYQPNIGYPPVKQSKVFAQEIEQSKIVTAQAAPFQLPFPGYLSQGYYKYHPALDIATGLGMPIKPIAPGKVISAGYDFFGYGLKVEIDHGNGYKSLYAHLGKIYVKEGQDIPDGKHYIGDVGMTGRTTGPHTHLEVTKDGKSIDARSVLPEIRLYSSTEDFQPIGGKGQGQPKLLEEEHAEHKDESKDINIKKESILDKYSIVPQKTIPEDSEFLESMVIKP